MRMRKQCVLNEGFVKQQTNSLNVGEKVERVVVQIKKSDAASAFDVFGTKIHTLSETDDSIKFAVYANLDTVIGWALQHTRTVEVLEPQEIRRQMRVNERQLRDKYLFGKTSEDKYYEAIHNKEREVLVLDHIDLSDKKEFLERTDAKVLSLNDNNITDFSFIEKFPYLYRLSIRNNAITELRLNENVYNGRVLMRILELENTQLTSLDFLNNFRWLGEIHLVNNPIEDYSPLYRLENISRLCVDNATYEKLDKEKLKGVTITIVSDRVIEREKRRFQHRGPLRNKDKGGD